MGVNLGYCSQVLEATGDSQPALRFGKLEEDVEVGDGDVAAEGNGDAMEVESTDTLLMPLVEMQLRRIDCWEG